MSGLSASALGVAAGLSTATVSMIEAGERKDPSSKTLSALARVLGISLEWLIDGTGDPPEEGPVREHTSHLRSGEHPAAVEATGTEGKR